MDKRVCAMASMKPERLIRLSKSCLGEAEKKQSWACLIEDFSAWA